MEKRKLKSWLGAWGQEDMWFVCLGANAEKKLEQRGLIFYQVKPVIRISITNIDSPIQAFSGALTKINRTICSWQPGVAEISKLPTTHSEPR